MKIMRFQLYCIAPYLYFIDNHIFLFSCQF